LRTASAIHASAVIVDWTGIALTVSQDRAIVAAFEKVCIKDMFILTTATFAILIMKRKSIWIFAAALDCFAVYICSFG